jgi:hypothetical protein
MYYVEIARNGLPLLFYNNKPLISRIDPSKEARLFVKEQKDFLSQGEGSKILIFSLGFGLGYCLMGLVDEPIRSLNNLTVWAIDVEGEQEIFRKYAPPKIQKQFQVKFFNPYNKESLKLFEESLRSVSYKDILIQKSFVAQSILSKDHQKASQQIDEIVQRKLFNLITDSAFGSRWWHNFLINYTFETLSPLQKLEASPNPVILVGSGLSTYESLNELKKLSQTHYIVAVLPVLNLLLQQGIVPDVVVVTDGGQANRHYTFIEKLNCYPHVLLVGYFYLYPFILKSYRGVKIFMNSAIELEELLTYEFPPLHSGGSVASSSLDVGLKLSSSIYYVGFDFAYSKKHPHFPGSPLEEEELYKRSRLSPLETVVSKKVFHGTKNKNGEWTTVSMQAYKDFFNKKVTIAQNQGFLVEALKNRNNFSSSLPLKKELKATFKSPLSESNKISRLEDLLQEMHKVNIEKDYNHPFFSLLLSRTLLKKQDAHQKMKEEILFLKRCLNQLKKSL